MLQRKLMNCMGNMKKRNAKVEELKDLKEKNKERDITIRKV